MRTRRKLYLGAAGFVVAVGAMVTVATITSTPAEALTMGDRRDCNYTDVIIDCGAVTQSELLQKYDSNNDGRGNRDIQAIFAHYGIERSDIAGTTSEVKRGWLSTSGVITVDGKTVATEAESLYRVKVDKPVSPTKINGKTYYIGPVSGGYRKGADVYVFFKNGVFHAAIQSSCGNPIPAKPVKPEPKPNYGVLGCDSLSASKLDRTRYSFTASGTASGDAEIVSYVFDFGDGTSETSASSTIEHTYSQPGTYHAQVSVNGVINDKEKTVNDKDCKTTVTIEEKPENCPLPGKEHLPKDSPECKEDGKCPIPGFEHLPADSPDCVEPPCEIPGKEHLPKDSPECVETPQELPKTGFELFIGSSLGVGSITAAGYYYVSSRKNLLDTFLKR